MAGRGRRQRRERLVGQPAGVGEAGLRLGQNGPALQQVPAARRARAPPPRTTRAAPAPARRRRGPPAGTRRRCATGAPTSASPGPGSRGRARTSLRELGPARRHRPARSTPAAGRAAPPRAQPGHRTARRSGQRLGAGQLRPHRCRRGTCTRRTGSRRPAPAARVGAGSETREHLLAQPRTTSSQSEVRRRRSSSVAAASASRSGRPSRRASPAASRQASSRPAAAPRGAARCPTASRSRQRSTSSISSAPTVEREPVQPGRLLVGQRCASPRPPPAGSSARPGALARDGRDRPMAGQVGQVRFDPPCVARLDGVPRRCRCSRIRSGLPRPASTASRTRSWTNRCSPGVEGSTRPARRRAASSSAARHSSTGTSSIDRNHRHGKLAAQDRRRPQHRAAVAPRAGRSRALDRLRTPAVTDDATRPIRWSRRTRPTSPTKNGFAAGPGVHLLDLGAPRPPADERLSAAAHSAGQADLEASSCHVEGSRGRSATGRRGRSRCRGGSPGPSAARPSRTRRRGGATAATRDRPTGHRRGRSATAGAPDASSRATASNSRNRSSCRPHRPPAVGGGREQVGRQQGEVGRHPEFGGCGRARSTARPERPKDLPPRPVRRRPGGLGRRDPTTP